MKRPRPYRNKTIFKASDLVKPDKDINALVDALAKVCEGKNIGQVLAALEKLQSLCY